MEHTYIIHKEENAWDNSNACRAIVLKGDGSVHYLQPDGSLKPAQGWTLISTLQNVAVGTWKVLTEKEARRYSNAEIAIGNGEYTAKITKDKFTVGCQNITPEQLKAIIAAAKKAKFI